MTHDFVVLDTDVASLSFKQQLPPSLLGQLIGAQPCITFVTLGELTKWAEMRRWGRRTREELDRWLDLALLLPYDREVATVWGELQAVGARRGRTPPQNDTWIAACCLVEDLPLATRNVKDYAGFAEYGRLGGQWASPAGAGAASSARRPTEYRSEVRTSCRTANTCGRPRNSLPTVIVEGHPFQASMQYVPFARSPSVTVKEFFEERSAGAPRITETPASNDATTSSASWCASGATAKFEPLLPATLSAATEAAAGTRQRFRPRRVTRGV